MNFSSTGVIRPMLTRINAADEATKPRLSELYCMNHPWLTTTDWPVSAFDGNAARITATSARPARSTHMCRRRELSIANRAELLGTRKRVPRISDQARPTDGWHFSGGGKTLSC